MKNAIWAIKMVWYHGLDAVQVFRINRAMTETDSVMESAQIAEQLDQLPGRGWFGLRS